jgi:hypothetical protein
MPMIRSRVGGPILTGPPGKRRPVYELTDIVHCAGGTAFSEKAT